MMNKAFRDLSANSVQVILNQLLGIIIFYITSKYLTKEMFGDLNWSLAAASMIISIAGCGIDLMVVKKIATGENVRIAGLLFVHVLFSSGIIILLFVSFLAFCPSVYSSHMLLPGIMISQVLSFLSSPYKQIANGKSLFTRLAIILTIPNVIKALLLVILLLMNVVNLRNVIVIYIIGSAAELITGLLLTTKKNEINIFPLYWDFRQYISLVKESLPQLGITVFNVLLARFDWFILGILTSTAITAEYSFAYKIFELSRLPLLAISPVLIPVFTRTFNTNNRISRAKGVKLKLLFRAEMVLSVLLPLMLVSCWVPLIGSITDHKYGSTNETIFTLLSICVPLQFATDYYWNMCFAQNQLRLTLVIAVISSLANILLNVILIPIYEGEGAAVAYIACFLIQLLLFRIYTGQDKLKPDLSLLFRSLLCGVAAILVVKQFGKNPFMSLPVAIVSYLITAILTRLIVLRKIRPAIKLMRIHRNL